MHKPIYHAVDSVGRGLSKVQIELYSPLDSAVSEGIGGWCERLMDSER